MRCYTADTVLHLLIGFCDVTTEVTSFLLFF